MTSFSKAFACMFSHAMEEEKTVNTGLYESNKLSPLDCERLNLIFKRIIKEGRIRVASDDESKGAFAYDTQFMKMKE